MQLNLETSPESLYRLNDGTRSELVDYLPRAIDVARHAMQLADIL